jgi:hypothetical protein
VDRRSSHFYNRSRLKSKRSEKLSGQNWAAVVPSGTCLSHGRDIRRSCSRPIVTVRQQIDPPSCKNDRRRDWEAADPRRMVRMHLQSLLLVNVVRDFFASKSVTKIPGWLDLLIGFTVPRPQGAKLE